MSAVIQQLPDSHAHIATGGAALCFVEFVRGVVEKIGKQRFELPDRGDLPTMDHMTEAVKMLLVSFHQRSLALLSGCGRRRWHRSRKHRRGLQRDGNDRGR